MSASRAALRAGIIGGLAIGLAVVAQQTTDTVELRLLGLMITFGGLGVVGLFAARDAGTHPRSASMRAGAIGGLIAGLVAGLAVVGLLLVLSVNGEFAARVQEALQQLYTPDQLRLIQESGLTLDVLTQATVAMQMMCCGAGLPIVGLVFGALGGSLASSIYRQDGQSG